MGLVRERLRLSRRIGFSYHFCGRHTTEPREARSRVSDRLSRRESAERLCRHSERNEEGRECDVESSGTSLELPSAVDASPAHGGRWPRSLYLSRVGLKAFAGANGFEKRAS
jgi:hypothetical protein